MNAFHSGDVTFWRDYRKFRTYSLIYAVVGRSTVRCFNRTSATSPSSRQLVLPAP